MTNGQFAVIVQEAGQKPSLAVVGNGATVASALRMKKLDPQKHEGSITLNSKKAKLTDRVKQGDLLAITPNTAGGR